MRNPKMTRYINQDNENISIEDAIALATGQAKPMWKGWRQEPEELFEQIMECRWGDMEENFQGALEQEDVEPGSIDWADFSCPINKWENLTETL